MRVPIDRYRFEVEGRLEAEGESEQFYQISKPFIMQQSVLESPFIVEDDHFARWRPIKQYRDV